MTTDILNIYNACETGDLDTVNTFLNSEEAKLKNEVSGYMMTIAAIKGGHIEILKILWNSSFKNDDTFNNFNFHAYGSQICTHNRFDMLKFMLNHPKIIENQTSDLMELLPRGIASHGRLEMLKYLFENFPNDPKLHANVIEGEILIHAARGGHLNIIEYLFNHNDYKDKIDIHIYKDEAFRIAYSNNQLDLLKYFIFNLNIEKTQYILNYSDHDDEVMKMFEIREFNKSLKKELNNQHTNHSTPKKIKL